MGGNRHHPRPQSRAPVAAAAIVLLVLLALTLVLGLHHTEGHLTYALDDAYIHLAMAKNLAEHGVWGVNRQEFSSTSSAPVWTALLGLAFLLAGPRAIVPLLLNIAVSLALLLLANRLLVRESNLAPRSRALVLVALVLFVPVVPMIATGQEHLLHLLLIVLFLLGLGRLLATPSRGLGRLPLELWIATPALGLVRYESLLLVGVTVLILALRRRWTDGAILAGLGFLPPLAFGLWSVAHGGYFFPNPVLLKANLPLGDSGALLKTATGYVALRRLFINAHLLVPLLLALGLLTALAARGASIATQPVRRPLPGTALMLFAATTLLHLTLADVGWFHRYEAYLVGLGILAIALGLGSAIDAAREVFDRFVQHGTARVALILTLLLSVAPLADRATRATLETPKAMRNIYEQQIQVARFLRDHCGDRSVAMNDIGAASFLADTRCVDLMGLANQRIADRIRARTYGPGALELILREEGVSVAVLYENWIRVPAEWTRVARWRIEGNVVTGGDTVAFFALAAHDAPDLDDGLRRFRSRLPARVLVATP